MAETPTTGWGSRASYEAWLCTKCKSENLKLSSDKHYWICQDCSNLMSYQTPIKERRVHD